MGRLENLQALNNEACPSHTRRTQKVSPRSIGSPYGWTKSRCPVAPMVAKLGEATLLTVHSSKASSFPWCSSSR